MTNFRPLSVLPNFNAALDQCRGERTEVELAREIGITPRTLRKWRQDDLPRGIKKLATKCPDALIAYIRDQNSSS